ncbi:hypothetical protein [Streptomyces sp. NBC_00162]|uniref:hypothetical protein n=1 Tax=Streptomyces sp. NBC_00162 TaxID=2903629 RepID=UPI00214B7B59|nr:hypothetical protein [Streptomyces sp. NBC_00162]UUU40761.1 hypothetical protein JIW86_19155 [Streptomyces sp. NBC_00162]
MRTRLLGFTAALVLAVLGAAVPVAQAAVPTVTGPKCVEGGGTVEYDATTGLYTCVGGTYDAVLITTT